MRRGRFSKQRKLWQCLAVLQAAFVLNAAQALTPDKIAARAIPSIVLIKTDSGLGTGFVVSSDGLIAMVIGNSSYSKKPITRSVPLTGVRN